MMCIRRLEVLKILPVRRVIHNIRQRISDNKYADYELHQGRLQRRVAPAHYLSISHVKSLVGQVFLPRGYPNSVFRGYSRYALFQGVGYTAGTVTSVLAMQSLLVAVGIGSSSSAYLPLAATMNWVLKDGLGQLGGILFAAMINNQVLNPQYHPPSYT